MINNMIIASVNSFEGKDDKNGKSPVILNVVAGTFPNRNVLSGTIAERLEVETGKTYLFNVREVDTDAQYGRQFVYSKLKELEALEIVTAATQMGVAKMVDVSKTETKSTTEEFVNAENEFENSKA